MTVEGFCLQDVAPQLCVLVYKPHELVHYIAINHSEMGIMFTNLAIINQLSLTTKSPFFAG